MNKTIVASFDVDPQNTFTPLCPNELPVEGGDQIVPELLQNHALADYKVVSRELHPSKPEWLAKNASEMRQPVEGNPNLDVKWLLHGEIGSYGAQLIEGLPHPVTGYDYCANKGMDGDFHPYGACYHDPAEKSSTGVIEFLKSKGVETVIVGGLATDYCVRQTVEQLNRAGFQVVLNLAACRGIEQASIDDAIASMSEYAKICKDHREVATTLGSA